MKKLIFLSFALLLVTLNYFASAQPVVNQPMVKKIEIKKSPTVEESIDAYFLALMEAVKCSNDVCKENALAATIGIPTPQSFNDAQLEQKVQDYINNKVSDFYCKIIIGGAYWGYINCAGSCLPIPYQGTCAINCANNYLNTVINTNCLRYL